MYSFVVNTINGLDYILGNFSQNHPDVHVGVRELKSTGYFTDV
jgi:hypothetical protein